MTAALVILGGAGGIGRALVTDALARGFDPIVLDLPASLAAHPPQVAAHPVDATDPASLADVAAALPPVSGFVNLCGFMGPPQTVTETDPALWDEIIAGNLTAAYRAARALAPRVSAGGAIVHVGSGLGHFARPGYGPYAVSKAAIAALTRQMALELAPSIRVNCVAPSAVDTAFLRGGTGRSDETEPERIDIDAYARAVPLGRIAEAGDVTGPILFLLSDAARYMTGQVLHVNGGTYMP
jgi:NAD(P)-dependent dehydrogenase (short-subunit alcohol dehydrogenase family)